MCDLMLNLDVSVVPENNKSQSRQHARDIRFMKGNKARERRDNLRHQKLQIQQLDTIQHLDKQNVKCKPESPTKTYLKKSNKEMKDALNGTIKQSSVKLHRKNEKIKGHNMLDEFSNGAARPEKQVTVTEDVPKTFANKNPSRYFGLDCEMVGTGPAGLCSELARCSIVTYYGDVVYDRYVKPRNPITDYRTRWSGITAKDLSKAIPFHRAKKEIVQILKDKVVVGHALHNDFKVIGVKVAESLQRDTSRSKAAEKHGRPLHSAHYFPKDPRKDLAQRRHTDGN
ncbi:interferon-stimulated 20 kDa exonuclease-like 2 [Lethenteron reissneri]|uniref:interferon-stimulated 20 kDa exonuclease-like 2 n=1 Tax=Lethenteron reissneri TaxID=7753 RepID=UPI002AB6FBAC|nr:interferon-stimulated 20 kDa exonuclease-like 2 [Lethenteron reissneri]XP_061413935.1 interferon-stimulated 20 kDa exonuclease-like 2 [Lethenteron reissneri]